MRRKLYCSLACVAVLQVFSLVSAQNTIKGQASSLLPVNLRTPYSLQETKPTQKADFQSFSFELQRCRAVDSNITCELVITNKGEDDELSLYSGRFKNALTRIFDEEGNEYLAGQVRLANKTSREEIRSLMVSDTGVKASITFEKVLLEAKKIKLLEIRGFSNAPLKVQFRNIEITR